jgi:hypothetical protein
MNWDRKLTLITELCRELAQAGLRVGMSDAKPAAVVGLGRVSHQLSITVDHSEENFLWCAGRRRHPAADPRGAAQLIHQHVAALRHGEDPPLTFDVTTPTPARVYDYYLGGKDNFAADREAGDKVMEVFPEAPRLARANRSFSLRAVQQCVNAGIDQVIDLGTGIPTSPNVAEVARAADPNVRVVGVDNDPIVLSHQRAAASLGGYTIIEGDVRRPWSILAHPLLDRVIDLSRPVLVVCTAVLHFIPDTDEPARIVAAFTDAIDAGSFIALSAATTTDTDPALIAGIEDAYRNATAPVIFRAADHIASWFDGLELLSPGLADVSVWPGRVGLPTNVRILGGVARKPPAHHH